MQAVLTCIDGSTCRDVAACIGRSEHHVLQWLIVFRDRGPGALLEESASAIESAARACVVSGNDTLKTDADTTSVKNRLHLNENVMLLAVEGVTPAEIASRMKITRQLVFTILIGLEVAGYEGTLKARAPRTKLTEADLAVIRAVIAAGVDPFDAGSALTQKSLLKYCKEQFQIEQVETTLRNFLSRKGIRVSDAPKLGLSNRDREGRKMRDFVVRHLAP